MSGGTTPVITYSESSLSSANANPVVCDSAGRADIFLTGGQTYRFNEEGDAEASGFGSRNENIAAFFLQNGYPTLVSIHPGTVLEG